MSFLRLVVSLLFPVFIFATPLSNHYAESFAHHFQEGKFSDSLRILDEWKIFDPEQGNKITGMRAAVYLSTGDFEKGTALMDQFIHSLSDEELSNPMMNFVLQMYYNAFPDSLIEQTSFKGSARLCKQEQPSGLKLKYWFGVGQVLVGILAAPFSAGTSTALILSGAAMVVDAACDALNNKESWERELNERQRINPDIERNSFFYDPSYFDLSPQCI